MNAALKSSDLRSNTVLKSLHTGIDVNQLRVGMATNNPVLHHGKVGRMISNKAHIAAGVLHLGKEVAITEFSVPQFEGCEASFLYKLLKIPRVTQIQLLGIRSVGLGFGEQLCSGAQKRPHEVCPGWQGPHCIHRSHSRPGNSVRIPHYS